MRRLETVSCSLNLGLIYSLNYSYSPQNGVNITLFFVTNSGNYNPLHMLPMQKANIKIGNASFSVYPIKYKISKSPGRRIMQVDFSDETFMLDNYHLVLTGRGCGDNVFEIGSPVDKRSLEQKVKDSLDPVAEKIKDFTQFPDLEYTFDEFLEIVRRKFSVSVNATYDRSITRPTMGTFRDVLNDWCSFYNLSFYFENSQIKIYDPTRLTINLPLQQQIQDVIAYEVSEDITSTYGKTVSNYFQQEGGERQFNQNFDNNSKDTTGKSNTTKYLTLFPIGYEFNLPQTTLDSLQVAAALFGKEFWFLYNLANNSLDKCGWTTQSQMLGGKYNIAEVDQKKFEDNFNAYYEYGTSIAGRWYLSNEVDSLDILMDTTWFSEADGQVFDVTTDLAESRKIIPRFLEPGNFSTNQIPGTVINANFKGVNYVGKRVAFYDEKDNGKIAAFTLTDDIKKMISFTYASVIPDGSKSMNLDGISSLAAGKNYAPYYSSGFTISNSAIPTQLKELMVKINRGDYDQYLNPRYSSYPIKGVRTKDILNRKDLQNQPSEISPLASLAPKVVSNTSLIKVKKDGAYTVYYDKYEKCASKSSVGKYFGHKFDINRISDDNIVTFGFTKSANTYSLNRNYQAIDALLNNPFLGSLAQARIFPTKTVTFTVNYYYSVPVNFISNGLVGIDMSFEEKGLVCSYTFSNNMLQVPNKTNDFQKYENSIKNSLIRTYRPNEVIT